jgi:hypothetical protein
MTPGRDLIIITCCAKKGKKGPRKRAVSIKQLLSSDAWRRLKKARRRVFKSSAFRAKGVELDRDSPLMRLLDRYEGHLYSPKFKQRVRKLLKRGGHVLIMSGGFGFAHPYEHTHWYNASIKITAALWMPELPSILLQYIKKNDIERVFIAGSSDYVNVLRAAGRLAKWATNVRVYAYDHSVSEESGRRNRYVQFGLRLARAVSGLSKKRGPDPKFWRRL